jgi:protocatechuate 3,4-dioxygenase beta subunit
MAVFKKKTVKTIDSVLATFTTAIDDLKELMAAHTNSAVVARKQASDLETEAYKHEHEAERASYAITNINNMIKAPDKKEVANA